MKRYFICALCFVSTSTLAEWTKLTYSDNSVVYIDESSIKEIGNIVEVHQLFDFRKTQKSPDNLVSYNSSEGWEAYDCKTLQDKTISFRWYSEKMGKGQVVYIDKGSKGYPWGDILKGSLSDAIRRKVCK